MHSGLHACGKSPIRTSAIRRLRPGSLLAGVLLLGAGALLLPGPASAAAASLPAPGSSGYLDVPGGRLYFEEFGSGFPIVLIHDGLAHREIWDAQVAALAPDYRVIRYDRRGYGLSDQPTAAYSNVADLHALMTGRGIERAVLIGSSAGGGLTIDFTLAHPEMVEALVLSGAVVDGLSYTLHFMKRGYANFAPDLETTLSRWIDDPYAVAPGNDAARARFGELLRAAPHNLDFAKNQYLEQPAAAALGRLREIRTPALILVGDRDIPDVHAHAGAIEAGIAGARRVVIGGAGHLPYLEQPEAFQHEVAEFLSLLSLGPGSPRAASSPAPPWDRFTRGFAPVANTVLYYETMGAGEPLVLIHGGAIDHRMWDDQFAALAREFRVIRYDVRGQGFSPSPFGTYRHYEDLRALLDHLGIERAHLMGLSLGCRIAADLAIAHPERVASLVLCSPGVSGYEFNAPEEEEYGQRISAAWRAADFAQAAEEFVRGWTDGPRRSPEQMPSAVRAKVLAMALENVRPDRDQGAGFELEPPAWGRLAEIHAPTLAILGELDMPGIHTIVRAIGEQVPGARVATLPDAAHMVNMERPEEFNRLVLGFLRERVGMEEGAHR